MNGKLIRLMRCSDAHRAEQVRTLLIENGLTPVVRVGRGGPDGAVRESSDTPGPIEIQIPIEQAETATNIIDQIDGQGDGAAQDRS